jgi:uncharacterized protein (DUF488 family)
MIWTVGHSTRTLTEFLALLGAHCVRQLVDVRRFPASRRFPHFGREALAAAFTGAGIAYAHEADLGGRRTPRPDSPNSAWRVAGFRGYADYMDSAPFRAALERLEGLAGRAPSAVLCAEAVPWRCHRQLIADALLARGHEVRHILGTNRAEGHQLPPFARVLPDGRLCYPGEPEQLDLAAEDATVD